MSNETCKKPSMVSSLKDKMDDMSLSTFCKTSAALTAALTISTPAMANRTKHGELIKGITGQDQVTLDEFDGKFQAAGQWVGYFVTGLFTLVGFVLFAVGLYKYQQAAQDQDSRGKSSAMWQMIIGAALGLVTVFFALIVYVIRDGVGA